MYTIEVGIEGIAPILQHKFGIAAQTEMEKPLTKRTGVPDYSSEWKGTCYTDGKELVQPGLHIEMAMVKAAASFRMPGARGRTYKNLFTSSVFVQPDLISFGLSIPDEPKVNCCDEPIYIDLRPVVVNRARVLRSRLALSSGWNLKFDIQVTDEQLQLEAVQQILEYAGRSVGIGDYRPRFGRFRITQFKKKS